MSATEPFLLDLAHRPFLAGESSRSKALRRARLGLLLVAAVLALCLFLTGWAGMEWLRWLVLRFDHRIVPGQVVSCRKDSKTDGEPHYFVTYRFEAATPTGPVTFQRQQAVSKSTYLRLHPGQMASVCHSTQFPSISSIADDTYRRDGISVGALMWLPITLFMGWQIRRCRREIRLGREGRLLEGRVTRCTGATDADSDFVVELHYRFTAPGGRVIRDRDTACRDDLKDSPLPEPGTPVAVLHLDEKNYKVL
jgi:hypothetical protein